MKSTSSLANLDVGNSDGLVAPGNPLLDNMPAVPKLSEAMRLMDQKATSNYSYSSREESILRQASNIYVSSAKSAGIVSTVVAQVRASYMDRDLRMPDYRNHTIAANNFLHDRPTRNSATPPSRSGMGPRARPRGIVVAAPVRMGRRCLADIVESVIGRGCVMTRVQTHSGFSEYAQLRSLRVQWPIEGKVLGFAQGFLGAFDSVFNTGYANRIGSPQFRESQVVAAVTALGVVSNLGLLIVEGIGTETSTSKAAHATWDALAHFTRTTGIPVLCLATPGAVICGLSQLPSVAGALAPQGLFEITRSGRAEENHWKAVCKAQFDATLRVAGIARMPEWLPAAAYDLTFGYPGLLATALSSISLQLLSLDVKTLNADTFHTYGKQALALHEGDINAVRQIGRGGLYREPSLVRCGDWLGVRQLSSTHPAPQLAPR
ncbi:hypothetical protein [Ralstonia chuxiongensis]|uniref:Uncharacterized protein n=1 Tax=Ralstonia chuxiongensis TaxID=2957504 RepID=A0AA41X0H0_9RALS|nr:hypothetical protein [Ralstonia chuxiongensis]MCP1174905.1 hypothetical protein [Ralstonia chuxiongensis]